MRGKKMIGTKQRYVIENTKSFLPSHIFECGQCFRWKKQSEENYIGVFKNNVLQVKMENSNLVFEGICQGDIKQIINNYFDMQTNYASIKNKLSKVDSYLAASIEYGSGIRILRQDLWEVIISFIISANNNIPRIQKIIEKISKEYGEPIIWNHTTYYTFPTKEQLAKASIEDLRRLGLGFRDKYVYETTRKILQEEVDLEQLEKMQDVNEIRKILLTLPRSRPQSCRLYITIRNASFLCISN